MTSRDGPAGRSNAPPRTPRASPYEAGGETVQPPICDIVRDGWTKPGSLTWCLSSFFQTASRIVWRISSSVGSWFSASASMRPSR